MGTSFGGCAGRPVKQRRSYLSQILRATRRWREEKGRPVWGPSGKGVWVSNFGSLRIGQYRCLWRQYFHKFIRKARGLGLWPYYEVDVRKIPFSLLESLESLESLPAEEKPDALTRFEGGFGSDDFWVPRNFSRRRKAGCANSLLVQILGGSRLTSSRPFRMLSGSACPNCASIFTPRAPIMISGDRDIAVRTGQMQSSQEEFVFAEYPSAVLALTGNPYILPLFRKKTILKLARGGGRRLVLWKYVKTNPRYVHTLTSSIKPGKQVPRAAQGTSVRERGRIWAHLRVYRTREIPAGGREPSQVSKGFLYHRGTEIVDTKQASEIVMLKVGGTLGWLSNRNRASKYKMCQASANLPCLDKPSMFQIVDTFQHSHMIALQLENQSVWTTPLTLLIRGVMWPERRVGRVKVEKVEKIRKSSRKRTIMTQISNTRFKIRDVQNRVGTVKKFEIGFFFFFLFFWLCPFEHIRHDVT